MGLHRMCGIIQRVPQKNNKKDTILYVISGFCHEVADNSLFWVILQ